MRAAFAICSALGIALLSCSPSTPNCTPANCGGCCDSNNACVTLPNQGFGACGLMGNACHACVPGQACQAGACVGDMVGDGGPPPDSGNPGSDAGAPCGAAGQACCGAFPPCNTGLTCQGGTCQTPPPNDGGSGTDAGTGTLAVGAACTAGSQCAAGTCGITGFPGGYCTVVCTSICPGGSACGADPGGSAQHFCLANCNAPGTTTGCRSGYVCEKKGTTLNGSPACYPACTAASCTAGTTCDSRGFCCGVDSYACCDGTTCQAGYSCGADLYCHFGSGSDGGTGQDSGTTGNGSTGSPCTSQTQCTGGECIAQNGGLWSGGYCSQACSLPSDVCMGSALCAQFATPTGGACLANCTYDGGQGDCRAGYVCDRYWNSDVNPAPTCYTACTTATDCQFSSNCENGFCCGNLGERCCTGSTCPFVGTCMADDYCN